ncbi:MULTISPECIES: hypothetical protein [Pseudomonas]|uniref:hypothetical protein n=1 Tax=Pseudomonas TaxID=286 RepID=UPI000CEF5066|nr:MULTISPECIES: hypothetical protein [Pseudomonas]PPS62641.1 hypothetical protein CR917_17370 [Pseudomonas sp. BRM28]WKL65473.1 hypothetical protein Q1Z72_19490 [Pseudomonas qingdaonensis]
MFLKNEAARLITINHLVDGVETSYPILPGENPAVEVPDAVKKIDFVKALLKNGDLRIVGADEVEDDSDDSDDDIEALREQAGRAGIKVNRTWGKARLLEEIAKASKGE